MCSTLPIGAVRRNPRKAGAFTKSGERAAESSIFSSLIQRDPVSAIRIRRATSSGVPAAQEKPAIDRRDLSWRLSEPRVAPGRSSPPSLPAKDHSSLVAEWSLVGRHPRVLEPTPPSACKINDQAGRGDPRGRRRPPRFCYQSL